MRYLNAVFTYNRPGLLKNCIKSFLDYGPEGDLLIVDDGSDLPEQQAYLAELQARQDPRIRVAIKQRDNGQRLGGLYANMNSVAREALAQGYDFVFFIQDDQQFMWRDSQFWQKVAAIYERHPDTLVVRPVFDKLIYSHDAPNRLQACADCPGILFRKSWFAAVGIVRPAHLAALDWEFRPTEVKNNDYARSLGLAMYLMKTPVLAFVPAPETWRYGKGGGPAKPPVRDYFMKPLSPAQIDVLANSGKMPYLEDYCFPWGWRAWAPYNFSDNRKKHMENLWRWFKKNRLSRWPKWQGVR